MEFRTFLTFPMLLCAVAVWLAGLPQLSEAQTEDVISEPQNLIKKSGTFGKRNKNDKNDKNDCDELGRMFIDRGCAREDSRRCRLLAFKLDGGRLSKRPRCNFMPCELYDQPTTQSCESFCVGRNVTSDLCETGKVCCLKGQQTTTAKPTKPNKPFPQPKCAFTCKKSHTCREVVLYGSCPYANDVCCKDSDNSYPFPNPYPQQSTCAHQCVSGFDCAEVDTYGSCGHYSLNVCCKKVGNQYFGGSNLGGGLQPSKSIFSDGFGHPLGYSGGYSIFDSDPFNKGKPNPPPAQPPQPHPGSEVQPLPCAYTCVPSDTCLQIEPASHIHVCGSYTHVCCRVLKPAPTLPPPVTPATDSKKGDDGRRGDRKRKFPKKIVTPRTPARTTRPTTTTTTTTKKPTTTQARRKPYTLRYTVKPPTFKPFTTTTTTTTTTTKETGCPFECVRKLRCAEIAPSPFTCGSKRVCCRTTKKP